MGKEDNRAKGESQQDSESEIIEARNFILETVVPQAGDVLRAYVQSQQITEQQKGAGVDLVTQADLDVDGLIQKLILKKYPDAIFLSEETAPESYDYIARGASVWVIDPLDGTVNFSRGNSNFAISIARVSYGKTELAVVHMPVEDLTFWADKATEKAYGDGKELKVSETSEPKKAVVAFDWPWDLQRRHKIVHILGNMTQDVRQMKSMGSAVADLMKLAEGKIDGYFHTGLKPWDVAAASLIVEKAGGVISAIDGGEWDFLTPDLLATNVAIYRRMLEFTTE